MISANDAAVALAEHDAGSVPRFVARMNRQARLMGLGCTHFSTPNGLKDRDNHSCAADLAALARADLAEPRIARIARTTSATPAFPIKGGILHLANNHYFLDHGLAGAARRPGHRTEDRLHRRRRPLLRDDRAPWRPPPRRRPPRLARPAPPGAHSCSPPASSPRLNLSLPSCKFTESDGRVVYVRCRSNSLTNGKVKRIKHYTARMIEWIAVYDKTSDRCYYVSARELGSGRDLLTLRLVPTGNNQRQGVRYAEDYASPHARQVGMEPAGLEPATSCLQGRRSPN